MQRGDQVRVWKEQPGLPKGAVGIVLSADEQSGYDEHQGDWWVEHLEVEFPGFGIHWLTGSDVAVVGGWEDKAYQREEETRGQREALTRKQIEEALKLLRGK
jgi:hypothetical protein